MLFEKTTVLDVSEQSPPSSSEEARGDVPGYIDETVERRVLRKLDFQMVPVLWLLFAISFIDRGNIGNAKIAGMVPDLKLKGNRYNTAVWVFTLAYCIFAIPANILFKKVGPRLLAVMMFLWGLTVIGQGVTKSYQGLVVCRFLEGVCEAGFVPGCAYLIGSYYKRNEFLRRYTFFFGAAIAAGAFNGLLATAISNMDGVAGYKGWRWIFIIEGAVTVLVSFVAFFFMFPFPEQIDTIFTTEEKAVLLARLKADGANVENDSIRLLDCLTDWKIWVAILIYFGAEENAASVVNFQPTILRGIGYKGTSAQIHTVPVYVVAWAFSMMCAFLAEWLKKRYMFGMIGVASSAIGLSIQLGLPDNDGVRYMGMFFLTAGPYIIMPLTVVWLAVNLGKGYKRTIGLGAVIGPGNCGAFVASNVFITKEEPDFRTGFAVGLGLIGLAAISLTAMYVGLRLANRARDRRGQALRAGYEHMAVEDLGEKHPDFRYVL